MRVTKLFTILCLLIVLAMGKKAKHSGTRHDWLIWMEGVWIRYIWLPITYYGFYKYLPSILCGMNLQNNLFDLLGTSLPGIDNTTAKAAVASSAESTCKSGFDKQYENIWYFNDEKKLIDGDWDYYNYTPSG